MDRSIFSPTAALEELIWSSDEENVEDSEEESVSSVDAEQEEMFLDGLDLKVSL